MVVLVGASLPSAKCWLIVSKGKQADGLLQPTELD